MGNNDTKNSLETCVNLLNKLFLGCVYWDMYEYKATGKHFLKMKEHAAVGMESPQKNKQGTNYTAMLLSITTPVLKKIILTTQYYI